jgi:hypothetical protein
MLEAFGGLNCHSIVCIKRHRFQGHQQGRKNSISNVQVVVKSQVVIMASCIGL